MVGNKEKKEKKKKVEETNKVGLKVFFDLVDEIAQLEQVAHKEEIKTKTKLITMFQLFLEETKKLKGAIVFYLVPEWYKIERGKIFMETKEGTKEIFLEELPVNKLQDIWEKIFEGLKIKEEEIKEEIKYYKKTRQKLINDEKGKKMREKIKAPSKGRE